MRLILNLILSALGFGIKAIIKAETTRSKGH